MRVKEKWIGLMAGISLCIIPMQVQGAEVMQEDVAVIQESDGIEQNESSVRNVNLTEEINRLRAKFPNGKFWNHWGTTNNPDGWTDSPCQSHSGTGNPDCNFFNGRLQCMGYASKIFYDVYGVDILNAPLYSDVNEVRAGDFITINNEGHYAFVISRNGDIVTVTECNSIYPQDYCRIYWDTTYNIRNCGFKDGRHAPSDVVITNDPPKYTVYGTEGERGSVSDTNAVLYAKLVTAERSGLKVGIQVGTASGNYNLVDHMDDMSAAGYNQLNANGEVEVWYDLNNELGITLSKGTRYYYRFTASHNGNMYYSDEFSFSTTGDAIAPTVISAKIVSYDKDGYTVTATASDNVGVTNIKFPTWPKGTPEKDILWYEGSAVSNGTSTCRINVSDFGYKDGHYTTDVRAYDAAGNVSAYYRLFIVIDRTKPTITDLKVLSIDKDGYTLQCNVSDNVKVKEVQFSTCTSVSGRTDWKHYKVSDIVDGIAACTIYTSDFGDKEGIYCTDIYAYDTYGNITDWSKENTYYPTIDRTAPDISNVSVTPISSSSYKVSCEIADSSALKSVEFGIAVNGKEKVWRDAILVNGFYEATIRASEFSNEFGEYVTTIRAVDDYCNEKEVITKSISLSASQVPLTGIELNKTSITMKKDCTEELSVIYIPANTTEVKNVIWKSSDESVAVVNNGVVTAKTQGNAVITATVAGKSASCNVNVTTDDSQFPETPNNWPFSDVEVKDGNWKYEAVKYVYENEIMNGISGTTLFAPDNSLNRAMFATVLYRMAGSPAVTYTNKFTDVEDGKYYSSAIIWANQKGIVSGFSDGSYGVNTNITREQIAKMLCEYASKQGYDISGKASLDDFTDKEMVSGWAVGYMQWAVNAGMISGKPNGDGTCRLDPKGEATRAECAKMLMMFMKKYGE